MKVIPPLRRLTVPVVVAALAAAYAPPDARAHGDGCAGRFEASVRGEVDSRLTGSALFFDTASDSMHGFILFLDTPGRGIIILDRENGDIPAPGSYPIGFAPGPGKSSPHATKIAPPDDFSATFTLITGETPRGYLLFSSESGSLTITESSPALVRGSFEYHARETLQESTRPPGGYRRVAVSGRFDAHHCPAP